MQKNNYDNYLEFNFVKDGNFICFQKKINNKFDVEYVMHLHMLIYVMISPCTLSF